MAKFKINQGEMWDNISYNITGDEFNLESVINNQYVWDDEEFNIREYLILPETTLSWNENPDVQTSLAGESYFKAPWE